MPPLLRRPESRGLLLASAPSLPVSPRSLQGDTGWLSGSARALTVLRRRPLAVLRRRWPGGDLSGDLRGDEPGVPRLLGLSGDLWGEPRRCRNSPPGSQAACSGLSPPAARCSACSIACGMMLRF